MRCKAGLFKVRYEDHDEEEMTEEEVRTFLVDEPSSASGSTDSSRSHPCDTQTKNDAARLEGGKRDLLRRREVERTLMELCDFDLSDVKADLPPIPSGSPRSYSRFKGVSRVKGRWALKIKLPSFQKLVNLSYFDSEEEAAIMFARIRYKYPALLANPSKPCALDLSDVPTDIPAIPQDKGHPSGSRFKGVFKRGNRWQAQIQVAAEGGMHTLGYYDSEEEAGVIFARARYKYPLQHGGPPRQPCPLDLSDVPADLSPIPQDRKLPNATSRWKGVTKSGGTWHAQLYIASERRQLKLGICDTEDEAGTLYARAHYKYSGKQGRPWPQKKPALKSRPEKREFDEVDGIRIEAFAGPSGPKDDADPCPAPKKRCWSRKPHFAANKPQW